MSTRSPITTHVLDTSRGRPASGVPVSLSRHHHASEDASGRWKESSWELLAEGSTDADGRVANLLPPGSLQPGIYRLRFDTATYFAQVGVGTFFYPWAEIVFQVADHESSAHYHVPLLLNPFGYSTYRGS
jgi:5-hydroxyisourate hydrolase